MKRPVNYSNKNANNYKHTVIDLIDKSINCESCVRKTYEVFFCTNDLTNSIWKLCEDCSEAMEAGETWW